MTASDLYQNIEAPSGLKIEIPLGLFINNEFVAPKNGETLEVVDPANGKPITNVFVAGEQEVDDAVKAARTAFKAGWKTNQERGDLLNKLADLLEKNVETLATLEAWDAGKAYATEAMGNIMASIKIYRYYAGWADKIGGKTIDCGPSKFVYTIHEPLGVCGQIIPWNYPFLMACWKIAPAVATGNCVVLKTAENTPLSLQYMAKLVKEAGFPAGVINIFCGHGRVAGAAIASHMDVDKVAFTGSTAVGKQIMKLASGNMKTVTLECGGKTPMLVFEDADLDKAVEAGHKAIMSNQGQTCTAISRYYVHEAVYDEFIQKFAERTKKVSKIGHPFTEGTYHGPQVSKVQQSRVLEYIQKGKDEGARVVTGGNIPSGFKDGFYVEPTIFADVGDDMTIMKEEIFGPVCSIGKFSNENDVIERANDSPYGLGASIFTKDIARGHRVASKLESGQVWINKGNEADYRVPFGGYKQSGIGRELGEYSIQTYTQIKSVQVDITE